MKSRKSKILATVASVVLVSAGFIYKKTSLHSFNSAQTMSVTKSMSRSIAQVKSEAIPVVQVPVQGIAVKKKHKAGAVTSMVIGVVAKDDPSTSMAVANTTTAGMPMLSTIEQH